MCTFGVEAIFHKIGGLNRHNFYYYSRENAYVVATIFQTRGSLNTWSGIVGDYVIDLIISELKSVELFERSENDLRSPYDKYSH